MRPQPQTALFHPYAICEFAVFVSAGGGELHSISGKASQTRRCDMRFAILLKQVVVRIFLGLRVKQSSPLAERDVVSLPTPHYTALGGEVVIRVREGRVTSQQPCIRNNGGCGWRRTNRRQTPRSNRRERVTMNTETGFERASMMVSGYLMNSYPSHSHLHIIQTSDSNRALSRRSLR